MKILFISVVLFFMATLTLHAQSNKNKHKREPSTDSLVKVLKIARDDTNKIHVLITLADVLYRKGLLDSAMQYTTRAIDLSTKLKFTKGKAAAYNTMGIIYRIKGNLIESEKNLQKSVEYYTQCHFKSGLASCYTSLGNLYGSQSRWSESLKYFKMALEIRKEEKDDKSQAQINGNIGNIYFFHSQYPEALKYFFESLKFNLNSAQIIWLLALYIQDKIIIQKP